MRPLCHADLSPGPEQSFEDAMRCYMVLYRRYYQVTANAPWHIRSVEDRQSVEKMAAARGDAKAQYNFGICTTVARAWLRIIQQR